MNKQYREKYGILSQAPVMDEVYRLIGQCSGFEESLLITGETGTGKELVARAIHGEGPRRDEPFIPVNCAAIPDNLLESELFGHAKGAFTGAYQHRKGKFQAAHGGSIFLDEIGHMPKDQQTKLLRTLEYKEVVPVGSNKGDKVDVRVILATSGDLKKGVESHVIDESFYHRVIVPQIRLPPLRVREGDIHLLSQYFLDDINKRYNKELKFDRGALEYLDSLPWPGNVRQLKRTIVAAAVASEGTILAKELLDDIFDMQEYCPSGSGTDAKYRPRDMLKPKYTLSTLREMVRSGYRISGIEKAAIGYALAMSDGNKTKAAKMLGITRCTLYAKLGKPET
jgi:DNA-binding NtrC family response regulator